MYRDALRINRLDHALFLAIEEYRFIIKQALEEYAHFLTVPPDPEYDVALAFDEAHDQYILRRIGWAPSRRIKYTDLHLAIRNGKIWIEEDMTEDGIANELLDRGVPRTDIVLGFQPPLHPTPHGVCSRVVRRKKLPYST